MNSVTPSTRPEDHRLQQRSAPRRLTGTPPRRAPRRAVRSGRPRIAGLGDGGFAHALVPRRVAQQLDRAAPHRLDRADRLQNPVDAVVHDLGQPAGAAGHDRDAARHRFQRREAERLGLRRQEEEIAAPAAAAPPCRAGPGSCRPAPRRARALRAPRPAAPGRRRSSPASPAWRAGPARRPDHVLDPLHLAEVGDVGHAACALRARATAARRRAGRGTRPG